MKRRTTIAFVLIAATALLATGGCDYTQYKSQRTVQLNSHLAPGNAFEAATHNGHITIRGAETEKCDVTASIEGRALTQERAKQLADDTKVTLQTRGADIVAVIDKPTTSSHESISVAFDVTLPDRTALKLETHNGAVTVTRITGPVACCTHNGAVTLTDIKGKIDAATHNGEIRASNAGPESKLVTYNGKVACDRLTGAAFLETHNGNIAAAFTPDSPQACQLSAVTHNGGVDITAPQNLSAMVTLSTHNGSVNTSVPITVSGKVSKSHIEGKAGQGEGKVHIETYNGSIRLR